MASPRSARSSETLNDLRQADALQTIVLQDDAGKLKLTGDDAALVFQSIPADILSGDYSNDQIAVLAKQITLLPPKDYAKFTRFVFGRIEKYFDAILYVCNKIAQLKGKEVVQKVVLSTNERGQQVEKTITLHKSDIPYIKKSFKVALKRVKDLLRTTKKTIRAVKPGEMANVSQPMFGPAVVTGLLEQFGEQIFGDASFVANNLPLASEGKFIKHSIMNILFMLTYRVKIEQLQTIADSVDYKPAQLRNDIKSWTDQQIEDLKERISIPDSGFPAEVAEYFRSQFAIHDYVEDEGSLTKVANTNGLNVEDALANASEITAAIAKKEPEPFSLESFKSYQVTRLLHNLCVSDVPTKKVYGDRFSAAEYAEAADYFNVIKDSKNAGFEDLRDRLMAESDAIDAIATQLREDKKNIEKPIKAYLTIIDKEEEHREEVKQGRKKSSVRK